MKHYQPATEIMLLPVIMKDAENVTFLQIGFSSIKKQKR